MTVDICNWIKPTAALDPCIAKNQVLTIENLEQILEHNDVMFVHRGDGTILMYEDVKGGKFRQR